MITADRIIKVLLILLLLMLWPLIGGQGGYIRVVSLSEELADIKGKEPRNQSAGCRKKCSGDKLTI